MAYKKNINKPVNEPVNEKVLECVSCGYKGKEFKELKLTTSVGSFRAKCPKCKKVDTWLIFG